MNTSPHLPILLNREKGQYPVSIATSLALESLLNIHPDTKHSSPPIHRFSELWINIRTIFRNLYGSMERLQAESLSLYDYVYGMIDDMSNIQYWSQLLEVQKPVYFYYSKYEDLEKKYTFAKFRNANTPIQKAYFQKQNETIDTLFKEKHLLSYTDNKEKGNVYVFKDFIKPSHYPSVGLLTHYAFDLCQSYSFEKLYLVESHIGHVKDKSLWYTKYYNGNQLPPLPFRLDLLQIFGDREMFHPAPKKVRELFIEMAKKYHFTPMTSKDRIKQCLSLMGREEIVLYYDQILKTT